MNGGDSVDALSKVYDKQQGLVLNMHPKLANHLCTSYPSRFTFKLPPDYKERIRLMARLAQKYPVEYQEKKAHQAHIF
jgi:hypothetical protein